MINKIEIVELVPYEDSYTIAATSISRFSIPLNDSRQLAL